MKIKNIENPEEFLKVIDSCTGRVELITDDGDRLSQCCRHRCRMLFPHCNPDKIPSLVLLKHFLKKNNFYSLVNKQF